MKTFFNFTNLDSEEEAELSLYDIIGFWGDSAKSFSQQLKAVKAPKIKLRINSPGGSVTDGYAIYNMLRSHKADVNVVIDGLAGSIASVIAMAGDTITMPANALLMIHMPSVVMEGNAKELRSMADDLDKIGEGIINIYEARTGMDRKAIAKLMDKETLMTAQEALDMKFADTLLPENKIAALFKVGDYFNGPLAEQLRAVYTAEGETIPPVIPTGGPEKQPTENMKYKTHQEAEDRVVVLESEATNSAKVLKDATDKAHQDTTTAVKTAETKRKTDIKTMSDKYNKDGDLNAITVEALANDTSADAFKDKVMEVINGRPAKSAIKPGAAETENLGDFETRYKACKTPQERQQLVAKNRKEAKAYLRSQS